MDDLSDNSDIDDLMKLQDDISDFIEEDQEGTGDTLDLENYIESLYYMWILWADFHIYIITPYIEPINPPLVIEPEIISETGEYENVYNILDHGYLMSTSRGLDIVSGIRSLSKLFNTIEKMIKILVERLRTSGIATSEEEVQVSFRGHELGQRKAFESILNLAENVVVTNFAPGEWGERFLKNIEELAKRGYGLPKSSPRSVS